MQDTSYPEPAQLRQYAQEPMPFTEVDDISLRHDGYLTGGSEHVEYAYGPTYIRFTPESADSVDDAFEVSEHPDASLDHARCWTEAEHVQVEEDFICATGLADKMVPEPGQFEAFWMLRSVTITVPR